MLVQTSSSPTSEMRSKIRPRGCLTRSDTILVSSRNRIVKDRPALPEDLRSAENSHRASGALQELPRAIGAPRLDNESLSFFSDNCVLSRQLEFARNSYGLIPPILEKLDVPLTHRN